jgi:DNA-directed RNA polymerase subunit RPC12/RpoP
MTENEEFYCLECKWKIPKDLIKKLEEGESIICEKCGFKVEQKYKNIPSRISKKDSSYEIEEMIKKSIAFAKNSIVKPIKDKIDKYKKQREQYKNNSKNSHSHYEN